VASSPQAIPTIALLSQSSVVTQSDLADYVGPYQALVNDWIAKHYPTMSAAIVAPKSGRAPAGAWIMHFLDGLNHPGAAGYHSDSHHKPVAYVDAAQDPLFTGSHELVEMLGDPGGNNLYTAPSPDPNDAGKQVEILDELADPCEDNSFALSVDGVALSDFITPSFGNGTSGPYDAAEKLASPREIGVNGYISWIDVYVWKQATNFDSEGFKVRVLGPSDQAKHEGKSLREWVDEQTRAHVAALGLTLPGRPAATALDSA
jgi:hypothetical protein